EDLREDAEALVGQVDDAHVRLDRGEGVVRREHGVLGERVEEGRLAHIGESDDADRESHGGQAYRGGYAAARPGGGRDRAGLASRIRRDTPGMLARGCGRRLTWHPASRFDAPHRKEPA